MIMVLRFLLLSFLLSPVSCLFQQRNSEINQSQRGNAVFIKDILNLQCRLHTGDRRSEEVVPYTRALSYKLEKKLRKHSYKEVKDETKDVILSYEYRDEEGKRKQGWINNFGYVHIEKTEERKGLSSSSEEVSCLNLLSGPLHHPLLIAKANHSYDVRFQLIGDFVRVLLLSHPKYLPSSSHAYSLKLRDDLYAMPMGGYKVVSGKVEAVENADREETTTLTVKSLPRTERGGFENLVSKEGIPHSYPKKDNGEPVKYVHFVGGGKFQPYKSLLQRNKKIDVYPKDFFKGEWYYALTPVTASSKGRSGGGHYQHYLSRDSDGLRSPLVRFAFREDYLIAYSTNIEGEFKEGEEESESFTVDPNRWVFQIPLKNLNYYSAESGKDQNAGLSEVVNDTEHYRTRPWAALNFNKVAMIFSGQSPFKSKAGYLLKELTLSSDYLGFLIEDEGLNRTFRFSLLKKPEEGSSSYSPIYLTEDMLNVFPAYTAYRRVTWPDRALRNRAYQERFPVERFNIKEPVRYYFSHLTPKEDLVRNLGRESVNIWNQVFKKAGVPCSEEGCFVADETRDVPLGDIRYNVFNFIDPKEPLTLRVGWSGFGPVLRDHKTGEIISATSSLHTQDFHRGLIYSIYRYIQRETGIAVPFFKGREQQSGSHSDRGFIGDGLFPFKGIDVPNTFLSLFSLTTRGEVLRSYDPAGFTRIYGFREKPAEQGLIEPVTSLEEVLSPEEKEHLLMRYRLVMGEEPPQDLHKLQRVLEHSEEEHGGMFRHCPLQEMAGGELTGDRVYSLIESLCYGDLSVISHLKEEKVDRRSPHEQRELLDHQFSQSAIEEEVINCADKVLPLVALWTTIHEQGHNINMRHNFKGSADGENFLRNEDFSHDFVLTHLTEEEKTDALGLLQPLSSTIMDYVSDAHLVPGGYDVAYMRYYYGEQMETRDGEIVAANFQEPESFDRAVLKPYRVCTEIQAHNPIYKDDIFCAMFDRGTTATEIVNNFYNRYIQLPSVFSLNKIRPGGELKVSAFFFLTRNIYHKWRRVISQQKREDSVDPSHFAELSAEEYNKWIKDIIGIEKCQSFEGGKWTECLCSSPGEEEGEIVTEGGKKEELRDLYCAKMKIAETLSDVLFNLHDHYCMAENQAGISELISFNDIHGELTDWDDFKRNVSSCFDVEGEFEKTGWKLTGELGYPLFPRSFTTDKDFEPRDYPYDYKGSVIQRLRAGFFLEFPTFVKKPGNRDKLDEPEFYTAVTLIDEPDIRESVQEKVIDRIVMGINQKSLDIDEEESAPGMMAMGGPQEKKEDRYYYNFKNEEILWSVLSYPLMSLSSIPRHNALSAQQGRIANLVRVIPIGSVGWDQNPDGVKFQRALSYKLRGGYIYGDTRKPQSEPLLILPEGHRIYTRYLIQSLSDVEMIRSFWDFDKKFLAQALFAEEREALKQKSSEELIEVRWDYIRENLIPPVFHLLGISSKPLKKELSFLLTYSLLFDYLVEGDKFLSQREGEPITTPQGFFKERRYYRTDYLVEMFQAGLVMEYKIKKAFKRKCEELNLNEENCPSFNILQSQEDLPHAFQELLKEEMVVFANARAGDHWVASDMSKREADRFYRINLFKPYFEYLKNHAEKNKEVFDESEEFAELVATLYELEAFKHYYGENSEMNQDLLALLQDLPVKVTRQGKTIEGMYHTPYDSPVKVTRQKGPETEEAFNDRKGMLEMKVSLAINEVKGIRERVTELRRALGHFPNNRFLRDVFFPIANLLDSEERRLYFSWKGRPRDPVTVGVEHLNIFFYGFPHVNLFGWTAPANSDFSESNEFFGSLENLPSSLFVFHTIFNQFMDRMGLVYKGETLAKVINRSFERDMDTINRRNISSWLYERQKRTEGEEELAGFSYLLQNRFENEIKSQHNILSKAFRAHLFFGNSVVDMGASGGGPFSEFSDLNSEMKETIEKVNLQFFGPFYSQ